jgi:hypothetical protein
MGGDAAGGGGNDTRTQVDSFRAFSAPPAQQPTGFDAGRGPSVTGAGNGTINDNDNGGNNVLKGGANADLLGTPAPAPAPNPGDSARGTQAQRGRNNAGVGRGNNATGTLLGEVEEIDVPKSGVDKLGNNSIPNGANQGIPTLQDIENLPKGGPTRPATDADKQVAKDTAELGALRGGFGNTVQRAANFAKENPGTAAASIFSPIPGTGALIAGAALKSGVATSKLNDAFNSGLITSEGLAPARGEAPSFEGVFGGDNNDDNNNLTSTAPRRVNAPTPQAAGSTAAQPQNLSFLQRLERQRGRAASSSTGASGQGRNASRTLLGT